MSEKEPRPAASSRRRLVLALAAVVLVALAAVLVLVRGGGDGDDPGGSAAGSSSSASSPSSSTAAEPSLEATVPGAEASAPTEDAQPVVDELPPGLPAVPLDQPAAAGDGVTATVSSIEAVDGVGAGRGNVSGPALRVTVRITNGTPAAVDLGGVAVDLTHGGDAVPASPLDDPSQAPFSGSVEPGATAQGVYVFRVPPDDRDPVTVSVGYRAGAPFMVFTGSAG
ncbi:hypothetical protein SAMN04488107_3394 [Geodermatophilus saharensis]|uniref:DUF4352 domain-containing protein n=1 Tax=Geodermatophilus saharensis TaxID=1137994 RepID=A0A239GGN2_9ACTN|nr:hypothetical protein [Geodermatophilus saharensis]SNS68201.1 hypothetical protein SAMN04488107_3394 [Geodermatophilus saharensis]